MQKTLFFVLTAWVQWWCFHTLLMLARSKILNGNGVPATIFCSWKPTNCIFFRKKWMQKCNSNNGSENCKDRILCQKKRESFCLNILQLHSRRKSRTLVGTGFMPDALELDYHQRLDYKVFSSYVCILQWGCFPWDVVSLVELASFNVQMMPQA